MLLIRKYLEYIFVLCYISLIKNLTPALSYKMGELLGDLIFLIDRRHRLVAFKNIDMAFKAAYSKEEKMQVVRNSFRNIGLVSVELCKVAEDKRNWVDNIADINGLDNVENAIKKGNGVIFLSGHIGNWEIMAIKYSTINPLNIIVRKLDNELLNNLVTSIRASFSTKIIYKKGAVKDTLKCLKNGETIGILMDQNAPKKEGVFADFFGTPACTSPLIAMLSLKTGAAVIPTFCIRQKDYRFKLEFSSPVELRNTGNSKEDIICNTAKFNKIIEEKVREYPDQWLWMHRRWKTRP